MKTTASSGLLKQMKKFRCAGMYAGLILILAPAALGVGRAYGQCTKEPLRREPGRQAYAATTAILPPAARKFSFHADDMHLPEYRRLHNLFFASTELHSIKHISTLTLVAGTALTLLLTVLTAVFSTRAARLKNRVQQRTAEQAAVKKQFENAFLQNQRMDAVGQLAGGVAHDFNNVMQAILGFSDLLLRRLKDGTPEQKNALEIQKAARHAAGVTRQLLSFSRAGPGGKRQIDLNVPIRETEPLLRLLGTSINCTFHLSPELYPVHADYDQIKQIVMNLALNARDAMPAGGDLLIATENITLEPEAAAAMPAGRPGSFVCISIRDTGTGISNKVKERLFEPFFTTKGIDQGTGLGLAVVYGIVKDAGGWITILTELGSGTTFNVYLPADHVEETGVNPSPGICAVEEKSILILSDDCAAGSPAGPALTSAGYKTATVGTVKEALQTVARSSGFDLFICAAALPDKTVIELVHQLHEKNLNMPVLFISRDHTPVLREELDHNEYYFLQKPFSIPGLLNVVYTALKKSADKKDLRHGSYSDHRRQ
ncbi:MAG: ATP-binding protein [Kiritimatiellales bacterium]